MGFSLQDFGSFYLDGRSISVTGEPIERVQRNDGVAIEIDPNGDYSIESSYVQFFLPINYHHIYILIHGGAHTGAIWETTPDGRHGWLHMLLNAGFGVYVIDTVERGRAGWCAIPNIWPGKPEMRSNQRTWSALRLGSEKNFKTKLPFVGQQFPIESFDSLVNYNVPRWNCNAGVSSRAIEKLLRKIDRPCSLIAYSQGSDIAMQTFFATENLLRSIVLLEPAAFPLPDNPDQMLEKNVLILFGDFIEQNLLWHSFKEKAEKYANSLTRLGMKVDILNLPEKNIYGNSHMIMMDRNNEEALDTIIAWDKANN
mgnify:CR=1 FL=1